MKKNSTINNDISNNEQEVINTSEEIEDQYYILKEEDEQEDKRRIILLAVIFFLIFTISFAGTGFSYLSYKNAINSTPNQAEEGSNKNTNNNNNNKTPEEEYVELSIMFDAGNKFEAIDVKPGWVSTDSKTFSIENTGNKVTTYNVLFKDITSTFNNLEDLVYTLKKNGEVVISESPVPDKETIVLENVDIDVESKDNYELVFKYKETGVSQNQDIGKTYQMAVDISAVENELSE